VPDLCSLVQFSSTTRVQKEKITRKATDVMSRSWERRIWPFTAADFVGPPATDKPHPSITAGGDEPPSVGAQDGDGEICTSVTVERGNAISLLAEVYESS
jgi:hypothetical protein